MIVEKIRRPEILVANFFASLMLREKLTQDSEGNGFYAPVYSPREALVLALDLVGLVGEPPAKTAEVPEGPIKFPVRQREFFESDSENEDDSLERILFLLDMDWGDSSIAYVVGVSPERVREVKAGVATMNDPLPEDPEEVVTYKPGDIALGQLDPEHASQAQQQTIKGELELRASEMPAAEPGAEVRPVVGCWPAALQDRSMT